jgi:hypothetical protein
MVSECSICYNGKLTLGLVSKSTVMIEHARSKNIMFNIGHVQCSMARFL